MKRVYRRLGEMKFTFAQRLMIVFTVVLFLPFSYIIYMYSSGLTETAKSEVVKPYEQAVELAAERYSDFFSEIERDFDFLNKYTLLRETLETDKKPTMLQSVVTDSSLGDVLSIMFAGNSRMSVMIYHDNPYLYNPRCFDSIESLKKQPYYDDVMKLTRDDNLFRIGKSDGGYRFYIYRKYNTLENRNVFFEISISYADFIRMLSADSDKSPQLYFTFNDGATYLLDRNEPQLCSAETGRAVYTIEQPTAKGCKLTGTFKKAEYRRRQAACMLVAVLVILLMGVLLLFAVRIMVRFLTKRLDNVIEAVTEGKKLQRRESKDGSKDEFDIISDKLIEYSEWVQRKNEEELEKQRKVAELELMLLQERISPHFLYNTLSSIKWAYQNPELSRVIDSMVKYYRVLLNRGSSIISLGDELVGVEEYLKIQKFVYEKEFDVEILCPDELKRIKILKSLLQPIVENAFVHGLNSYEETDGFIKVSVERDENVMRIVVENNGIIISDEAIAKIFDGNERTEVISAGSGYAMKNIIKRIKLYYGDAFGLEVHGGSTTTVIITIPYTDGQAEGQGQ